MHKLEVFLKGETVYKTEVSDSWYACGTCVSINRDYDEGSTKYSFEVYADGDEVYHHELSSEIMLSDVKVVVYDEF